MQQYSIEPLPNSEGNIFPLQHLTINFTLYLSTDPLNSCHWNRWAAFDTLLGKPEFASLETVELKLASNQGYRISNDVCKRLSEKLPSLEGSGKLVVRTDSK